MISGIVALLPLLPVLLAAQQGVNFYSIANERALGEQMAAQTRKQTKPVADAAVQAYVARVGAELAGRLENPLFEYRFEAVDTPEALEPMAIPGWGVFVPVRALSLARDEDEFAGLMAHAIGHVALRHGTRMATRQEMVKMASIPLVYMGGWHGAHADSQSSSVLLPTSLLPFQRKSELEADRFGVDLASRAGFDPSAFLRYIEREQKEDSQHSPLPPREARIAALREAVASLPAAERRAASDDFQKARSAVLKKQERPAPTLIR